MDNVKIAKELIKLAKELSAAGDEREKMEKQFEKITLGGRDADELAKNVKEYQKLCEEWAKAFPDELPPIPGKIELDK